MSGSTAEPITCFVSLQACGGDPRQVTPARARRLGFSENRRPDPFGFVVGDLALKLVSEGWDDNDALAEAERRVRVWTRRWPARAARAAR